MPPRYAYWTILAGGLPTAFRASEREELMPTFQRLREKHPDAEMKWFSRGKLWNSPEEARRTDDGRGGGGERRPRDESGGGDRGAPRGRDWGPGGGHRDPRQKYVDAKKARNASRRQERFDRRQGGGRDGTPTPAGREGRPSGPAGAGGGRRPAAPSGAP